ncbi:MAG: L-histidine N(alpha)-methyltransferase [Bacteroidota bacterium]
MSTQTQTSVFAQHIHEGLSQYPKRLSSRYFYDAKGSELFRQIMRMESYYLTDAEYEIFENYRADLLEQFAPDGNDFQLIEFGAGDGLKTRLLLEHFLQAGAKFEYLPIDISGDALAKLTAGLEKDFPKLNIKPLEAEYFSALEQLEQQKEQKRKVVLFLGSNLGNFQHEQAVSFLKGLRSHLNKGDLLLIGLDLKKEPAVVLEAYNDKEGITKAFNLNLLERINRELGGNFDLESFDHWETYDPLSGETRSYIISKRKQRVWIEALQEAYQFEAWEPIWTELSQKYDFRMIESLAQASGFKLSEYYQDQREYFVDAIWEAV